MELTPRDRRALIVLGAVAAVAVVFFLVTKVLGGGGGEEAASTAGPTAGPTAAPSPAASPTPSPRETLPPVVLAGGRDPFSIPPELSPTPSGGVSPSPSGSPTGSPSPSPSGTGTPSPTPTAPGGGSSTTIGGHTVVLLDVFTREGVEKAQVEVDGTVYTVNVGERFDGNFELVSVSGSCARFLFGDQGFALCVTPQK